MARPLAQARSTTLHFIDDRFETLEALCHQSDLAGRWRLHFATWGHSTDAERTAVMNGALPGVRPLGLPHLCELLRWAWLWAWTTCASRQPRRWSKGWLAAHAGSARGKWEKGRGRPALVRGSVRFRGVCGGMQHYQCALLQSKWRV